MESPEDYARQPVQPVEKRWLPWETPEARVSSAEAKALTKT